MSLELHPLIRFHRGAAGRSHPLVVGTRLRVDQVIATLRESDGDTVEAADYFGIAPGLVGAALAYYAEFADEVDAVAVEAERAATEEWERWERGPR